MNFGSPAAAPRRRGIFFLIVGSGAFVVLAALLASRNRALPGAGLPKPPVTGPAAWERTSEGDFEEQAAEFTGSRLRLRAATRRTRSDTVKFVGVRRREPVRLTEGARIAFDLDWNGQANGSGLEAGLVLAPASTAGNPFILPDTFSVVFVGVPPGKNARRTIGVRKSTSPRTLDNEGWPDRNREGRPIGVQRIEIRFGKDGEIRVFENGAEAYASGPKALDFEEAYVYLQMSSRSNYPPREVLFDRIVVEPGK